MAVAVQPTLCSMAEPSFDRSWSRLQRTELADGAWFDLVPGWLEGDQSLLDQLREGTDWQARRRPMYDRIVDVPRLTATIPERGPVPAVLRAARRDLVARYGEPFRSIGLAYYRDGADSVAPHGDQIARDLDTSIMATISLGARRRFVLSSVRGGTSVRLELGEGDLLVMGGTIQRTWRHGVPKTSRPVGPRISVMIRPSWLG